MSDDQGLQTWPTTSSQRTSDRPVVPILIQVPALPALMSPSARPSLRVRAATSPHRRRRRLRREVRVAAYAMMLAAPLVSAPLWIWGEWSSTAPRAARPEPACAADGKDLAVAHHPPVISISIEPATGVTGAEAEPPVVFPGYLLPDDDSEEPAHAGS
jgi:hypothetical protein